MRLTLLAAVTVIFGVTGCAERLLAPEILQQRIDDRIYTNYTIWYEAPENISSLNIQRGNVIPAGTEVEVVKLDDNQLAFRDTQNNVYVINFEYGERMCSMRDFVRQILTLTPPEKLFEQISVENVEKIKKGEIAKGMSAREVILAYGPPPPVRTPDLNNSTWYYWTDAQQGVRVVFRGGKVRDLLVLE